MRGELVCSLQGFFCLFVLIYGRVHDFSDPLLPSFSSCCVFLLQGKMDCFVLLIFSFSGVKPTVVLVEPAGIYIYPELCFCFQTYISELTHTLLVSVRELDLRVDLTRVSFCQGLL